MVGFMDHDGLERVASSMSQGNGPQVSECSAMSFGRPKKTRRRRRQRAMTTGAESGKENEAPKVKKPRKKKQKPCTRDSEGCLLTKKGTARRKRTIYYTPPRDSKGRFLPKGSTGVSSDTEHNYSGFMNAQAPDFATIISILHGNEGMKHCNRIRRLKNPDFVPLMNAMNNSGQKTVDEGPYDVLKVLMQADGSVE